VFPEGRYYHGRDPDELADAVCRRLDAGAPARADTRHLN
jgi:hypothetical protein